MNQESVFLCHNSRDKKFVARVYKHINKHLFFNIFKIVKITPWLDEEKFIAGNQIDQIISKEISYSRIGIVFLSKHGIGNYQIDEIMQFKERYDQKEKFTLIPILLPGIQKIEDVQMPLIEDIKKVLVKKSKASINNIDEREIKKTIEEIQSFLGIYHWIKIDLVTKLFWKKPFLKKLEEAIKEAIRDSIKDNISIKVPYAVSGGIVFAGGILLGSIVTTITSLPSLPPHSPTPLPTSAEFKFVLKPGRKGDGNFHNGLARVRINGKAGYIDREGKTQILPNFDGVLDFSKPDNLSLAWKYGENRGYINNQGNYQIKPKYGYNMAGQFSEGKAYVCIVSTCGYIDSTGKEVIERKFTGAGRFYETLAPVKTDGKWGYINQAGTFSIPPSFEEAYQFREGLAPINKDNQWIYIDKNQKPVIQENFDKISYFSEGLAAVKHDNKWGYIDPQGNIVIQPQFDEPKDTPRRFDCDATDIIGNKAECKYLDNRHDFSEGLAAIYMNGKWGYIDRQGNPVIPPQFSEANNFSERLAYVCQGEDKDKKCGYISHPIKTLITKTSNGFVNLRDTPSVKGTFREKILDGRSITILSEKTNSSKETWYQVEVNNKVGWIYSVLLK
ncbi:WG repeat-containing protein [Nostoc sp. ChiQUE01b]|uniref:WG repeat-containing protein n=1 Tax=Nostoc sp. ChiQUE01b TaxID=3075376 RepID=UPI002AD20085|nr:WG repeat-containing protein [Nostoc sp. ChiQUE01b]MDZ8260152.1 WG repeat-containing protein [Nostoc sp. ChiQUE01b]